MVSITNYCCSGFPDDKNKTKGIKELGQKTMQFNAFERKYKSLFKIRSFILLPIM
jgi:hypothetical protein